MPSNPTRATSRRKKSKTIEHQRAPRLLSDDFLVLCLPRSGFRTRKNLSCYLGLAQLEIKVVDTLF